MELKKLLFTSGELCEDKIESSGGGGGVDTPKTK